MSSGPTPTRPADPAPGATKMHLLPTRAGDPAVLMCEAGLALVLRPGETEPRCSSCGAPPCDGCRGLLAPTVQA